MTVQADKGGKPGALELPEAREVIKNEEGKNQNVADGQGHTLEGGDPP